MRDEVEFEEFYAEHAPHAYRLATALTGDPAAAGDTTQAVFERLCSRRRWKQVTHPRSYLRAAITRQVASDRRSPWSKRVRVTDEVPEDSVVLVDPVDQRLTSHELVSALAQLPLRQRQAVVLRYLEDIPVAEVAVLMRCSPGTVKASAFQGLRNLRSALSTLAGE